MRQVFSNYIFPYIRQVFSLDTKALSVFRIALGILIVVDICIRLLSFEAFFLDTGLMPIEVLNHHHAQESLRSIYTISATPLFTIFLISVHLIIATCFIVGYKTRHMSIALWFMTVSMQSFNPMILNGGDSLLRVCLFRSMFLPLSYYYSLDSCDSSTSNSDDEERECSTYHLSAASVGFIIQLSLVYIFSFILKDHPIRTELLTGTYYALSIDAFRTPLGDLLYQQYDLMKIATNFVYHFEGYAILLLLIPWKNHRFRTAGVAAFIGFHGGLIATMKLGPFPWFAIAYWLAFLPLSALEGKKAKKELAEKNTTRYCTQIFLYAVLAYILSRNIRTTDFDRHAEWFPYHINKFGFVLKVEQYRNMFAPYPFLDDGWFEITGTDNNGKKHLLNSPKIGILYTGNEDPNNRHYLNEKRHKRYTNMRLKENYYIRNPYMEWICRNNPTMETISIQFTMEKTMDNYQKKPEKLVDLATLDCEIIAIKEAQRKQIKTNLSNKKK